MGESEHEEPLIGLVADERLLTEEPTKIPSAVGRPQQIRTLVMRPRLVGIGATLTGATLIGGTALAILGASELLFANGGALAIVALVIGIVLAATHWGWVHVAEVSAEGIERRGNVDVIEQRRAWLSAIAPFTRYEITTDSGTDGSITIRRIRHRPIRCSDRTFAFEQHSELSETHPADTPAAVVAERAELLRRQAASDTERERERFQVRAEQLDRAALVDNDNREREQAQAAASRALSDQINANLRDPPLVE